MNLPAEFAKRSLRQLISKAANRELSEKEKNAVEQAVDAIINAALNEMKETCNLQQREINELRNKIDSVETEANATIQRMSDDLSKVVP